MTSLSIIALGSYSSVSAKENSRRRSSHRGLCVFSTAEVCYLPVKRSSGRPMFQQRNEPRLTWIPRAITYSIKFVVSLLVIVMNAQGDNFFVSQTHTKGDDGGWQSAQVDWIPCCRRVKRWRLMMQARTKVFWMRPETSTQCVTDRVTKKACSRTLSKKGALEMQFGWEQWPIALFPFLITRTASSKFEGWLCLEIYHPRKEKEPFTLRSASRWSHESSPSSRTCKFFLMFCVSRESICLVTAIGG